MFDLGFGFVLLLLLGFVGFRCWFGGWLLLSGDLVSVD